jgi:hypothetical protein
VIAWYSTSAGIRRQRYVRTGPEPQDTEIPKDPGPVRWSTGFLMLFSGEAIDEGNGQ